MERIVYRITLDSHKTGIQRTLQGFETADNMARTIAVNITASGDTYEIPLDNVVAMMYVTTPNASEPSINECRIEDNTIYYDVLPIVEEGITEMQIKLIETSMDGAKRVLLAPKFVVEVTESGTEDGSAEQTTTFTALENAIAKAHGVYDQRLLNIEIGPDCVFRAIYADGTVYENHYLHEALYNGNALLSESWAKGETGIREGEETNNSKYFSNVSKSSSIEASASADMVRGLVDMAKLYSTYTSFDTNFETGELEYISASHNFDVNEETGELEVEGELFDPSDVLEKVADEYLDEKTQEITKNAEDIDEVKKDLSDHTHTAEEIGAATSEEVTQLKSDLTKYLPKDGSVPMSGNILEFFGGFGNIYADNSSIMLQTLKTIGGKELCKLALRNSLYTGGSVAHALSFINQLADGISTEYKIYGEHNKPSGSYTGNGSATERVINIGGIGDILFIKSPYNPNTALVFEYGAFVCGITDTNYLPSAECKFKEGKLILNTANSAVNASNTTISYRVL